MDEFEFFFQQEGQPGLGSFRDPAKNPDWDRDRDAKSENLGLGTGTGTQN